MKKLSNKIILLIASILLWAIGGAFLFVYRHYFLAALCLLFVIYIGYKLYRLNLRTVNHFKLFTDSIKFSQSNISFTNNISDEIYLSYYNSLDQALDKINRQTQKQEANISFYSILLNRIDFALIVTNQAEKILWINKMALDMLGRPKPLDLEAVKRISDKFREVFESLQPQSSRTFKLDKGDKLLNLIVNLSTITVRGEVFNIYSIKDVQLVVDETQDIAWQQLIRVLTHEIMNSLTPIISLSENLSVNGSDADVLVKAMEIIHRRSKGLVSFVNNYKKLTQIPPPKRTNIKIKPLIEDILHLMKGYGVKLHTLITSDNLTLYADRGQIEQVLINLIKNSLESCSNTDKPAIKLTAMNNNHDQIIITVSDNGSGMEPDILDKIFTPFYTTKAGGSGIGLSICRQIISMHGGTLTATSTYGKGSLFTIRI